MIGSRSIHLQVKNTPTANRGAGVGVLVTQILLYLPRYKVVWFERC
jgi:hypothetical protein